MDTTATLKKIIAENNFMVIATSDDKKPWISPVFFATADDKTFYWHSGKDTKHSHIIARNPHIAVVIFNSTNPEIPGLYMKGKAVEVGDEELAESLEILFSKAPMDDQKRKDILSRTEDFQGEGKLRLYKFVAEQFYLSNSKRWHEKWLDWTEEVTP